MLKRLTCFVSGEHHFRVRERDGRVFLECQQCGQRSTGLETGSRPVLGTEPAARPLFGPRKSPLVTPSMPPPGADADRFLSEMLANGPMRQVDVTQAAAAQGIADRTLRRARVRLGVVATKHGFGAGSFWVWRLRQTARESASLDVERSGNAKDNGGRGARRNSPKGIDRTPEA